MSFLQDQYAALELGMLEQVTIPDASWAVLEKGLLGFGVDDFENALPISVARIQKDKSEILMDWAKAQKEVRQTISFKTLPILAEWKKDVERLDQVFFGEGRSIFSSNAIGPFVDKRGLAPALHTDGGTKERVYTLRLENLPTHVIRQAEVEALPLGEKDKVLSLIQCAMGKGRIEKGDDVAAKQELIALGILHPHPLGEVGLFSGDTKHCSAPLSQGKDTGTVYSAFLRDIRLSL